MKLKFQSWLENNNFSVNTKHLFDSAVKCYKSEVPTAALLMSYIGFLLVLKERIMNANKPTLFPQNSWNNILNNLKNDSNWEEITLNAVLQQAKFDSTKTRTQDPIFVINDNMRAQIIYWKDRRNDCAHSKDNEITSSHVEAFWSFLQSNLQKITVEGGKANLINKFIKHFDISYTPANEDMMPLVQEIKSTVEKNEMDDFWIQIFPILNNLLDYKNENDFINKVLSLNDSQVSESLIAYVKSDTYVLNGFIENNPSKLNLFYSDKKEIRNFWQKKVSTFPNPLKVYASMLRNNLIPVEEIKDANEHLVNNFKYVDKIEDHLILQEYGFGNAIYNLLFVKNKPDFNYWRFLNKHHTFYTQYIEYYPLQDEVVKIICDEMDKDEWRSHFLQSSLNNLFNINSKKKAEFTNRVNALKLSWPKFLTE
ncbi:hypothetical protein ACR78G_20200 [Sphingobacterium spiritivorum]|uniref:hypothetical protein n=1 Tax=Sphingobacterium spiritivorum TaxID=258 RepID=UPI003DA336AB